MTRKIFSEPSQMIVFESYQLTLHDARIEIRWSPFRLTYFSKEE